MTKAFGLFMMLLLFATFFSGFKSTDSSTFAEPPSEVIYFDHCQIKCATKCANIQNDYQRQVCYEACYFGCNYQME